MVCPLDVQPSSPIQTPRQSIRKDGSPAEVITKGRPDPCVCIRPVPVDEDIMACVILNHLLLNLEHIGKNQGIIG